MKYISSDQPDKIFHLPAGEYPVTIIDASETVSRSSGADMIKLTLEAEAPDGTTVTLFDYLVATPSSAWKIDAFRRALGKPVVKGESVELCACDLIGCRLRARLKVEKYNDTENNKVEAWLPAAPAAAPAARSEPLLPGLGVPAAADPAESVPF